MKMLSFRFLLPSLGLSTLTFLVSCATAPMPPEAGEATGALADSSSRSSQYAEPTRARRPGLATGWGETRRSEVRNSAFQRASLRSPIAVGKMYYNDESGSKAMAGSPAWRSRSGARKMVGGGLLNFGVVGGWGSSILPAYIGSSDERFVVGRSGSRYALRLQNLTNSRLEVLASVDGLDVIDGNPASYSKRGYVLSPGQAIKVEGFRRNYEKVAAFRFGKVNKSYAQRRHGSTRNVGVLGVAVFHEKGDRPVANSWQTDPDRRREADPFPERPGGGEFAQPPYRF